MHTWTQKTKYLWTTAKLIRTVIEISSFSNSKLISKIFCMKTKAKKIIKYNNLRTHVENFKYVMLGTKYLGGKKDHIIHVFLSMRFTHFQWLGQDHTASVQWPSHFYSSHLWSRSPAKIEFKKNNSKKMHSLQVNYSVLKKLLFLHSAGKKVIPTFIIMGIKSNHHSETHVLCCKPEQFRQISNCLLLSLRVYPSVKPQGKTLNIS